MSPKKALYGLKQSPRAWFKLFKSAMIKYGSKQCLGDHILFVKHRDAQRTTITVYIDDVVITGNDPEEIQSTKRILGK